MIGSIRAMHALLATVTLGAAMSGVPAAATPAGAAPCVLLVHDIGRDAASWHTAADRLRDHGRCAVPVTWGAPEDTDVPLPVAGLRGADAGADDLARTVTRTGDGPYDVIAHGAGSLVVQRYLQKYGAAAIRSLTTLGPLWNGTEMGGLAAAEDASRALGTYDLVLGLEKPVVDPLCAGCRELIRGSDLLRDLHRIGVPTPGVHYTDIATHCDELAPPVAVEGVTLIVLDHCISHFALPDDPAALEAALGR